MSDTPEFPPRAEAFFERVAKAINDSEQKVIQHVNRRVDELRSEMVEHFAADSKRIMANSARLADEIISQGQRQVGVFQAIAEGHQRISAAHAHAGVEIERGLNGAGESYRYLRDTDRAPRKVDPDAETNPEGHAVPERD